MVGGGVDRVKESDKVKELRKKMGGLGLGEWGRVIGKEVVKVIK